MSAPGDYKKLAIRQYPPKSDRETPEGKFWRSFRGNVTSQQVGQVTHIDVCPTQPYSFAITSSTRVIVYDGTTRRQKKVFSRFKDIAYSGVFRHDGKLVAAGGETGIVQLFDANSRAVLRQLKGHTQAVHFVRFGKDKLHVLSAGDDRTVRWWDITSQDCVTKLHGHKDYVRCGALSPVNTDVWATGSYDHTVRLWDLRTKGSVMELNHGHPLEDVVFFPAGGILATAGDSHIDIWDIVGGGRRLQRLQNHQKTVTVLHVCDLSRSAPARVHGSSVRGARLLSGSLDGHVKIFDLSTLKVSHAIRYPSPILSLGITPDASTLAVGMTDGSLSLRRFKAPKPVDEEDAANGMPTEAERVLAARKALGLKVRKQRQRPRVLRANTYRYFVRGRDAKAAEGDFVFAQRKRAGLAAHDRLLRQFHYGEALESALATARPEVVVSVIEELVAQGVLRSVVTKFYKEAAVLRPLMLFLVKTVTAPRHSALLVLVAHLVLDTHAAMLAQAPGFDTLILRLRDAVMLEARLQQRLCLLQGLLLPLMHASVMASSV